MTQGNGPLVMAAAPRSLEEPATNLSFAVSAFKIQIQGYRRQDRHANGPLQRRVLTQTDRRSEVREITSKSETLMALLAAHIHRHGSLTRYGARVTVCAGSSKPPFKF